jgi:hypothetical protein
LELFRLHHYRSPDVDGRPWQRTATAHDLAALPLRTVQMFRAIDLETHVMGQETEDA